MNSCDRFFAVGAGRWVKQAGLFLMLLGAVASAGGPEPLPENYRPATAGCGKARALAARMAAEAAGTGTVAALETMEETDVLHNDLDIEVSNLNTAANNCTIAGSNRFTIRSKSAALTTFTFRLQNQYVITSALINDVTPVTVTTLSSTTRRATLDRAYGLDEEFTLTIGYTGTTNSSFFGSFEVRNHNGTPVVSTLSEPYFAYTWWPTKDGDAGVPGDNSDKATLDMTITAPNNFVVAANGALVSNETLSGNRSRYHWSHDYPIVTYLVSFAATNYYTWTVYYNHPGGSMPVQFFIYPEWNTTGNRFGWELSVDMLGVFASLFGEYPFINEKYGIYNFPFGGGMEHQTITGQGGFGEWLTAHELSHQWWGDAVTCKTWSDIWLNEGFATYSECLWDEFKGGTPDFTAYYNCMQGSKPYPVNDSVYIPAPQTADPGRIFSGNLSYNKGAWVLHQLRRVVGDATFFQILANYRAAYEGSAATTDEFVAIASSTYGQDLAWFFDEWVYLTGQPAYRYGWATLNVGGQQYLHVKIQQTQMAPYPVVFTMPIDLVVTIGGVQQTITVWNDLRTQWYTMPVSAPVTFLQFDPHQWVLRSAATLATLRVGDMDGDSDVDLADYNGFSTCFTGEGGTRAAGCEPVDFDGDVDVDCVDWSQFIQAWTSPEPIPGFVMCYGALRVDVMSGRHVAVTLQPAGTGDPVALRVTSPDWPCLLKYVDGTGKLVEPADKVFKLPEEWGAIVVQDPAVVPNTTYMVESEWGTLHSTPGSGHTWLWGDVNNDGGVDFTDVSLVVDAFKGYFLVVTVQAVDLSPCVPDNLIDFTDVSNVVNAFKGSPYPCGQPCP